VFTPSTTPAAEEKKPITFKKTCLSPKSHLFFKGINWT
jgi:hypothetical protein